jgi:hypothetical protein
MGEVRTCDRLGFDNASLDPPRKLQGYWTDAYVSCGSRADVENYFPSPALTRKTDIHQPNDGDRFIHLRT